MDVGITPEMIKQLRKELETLQTEIREKERKARALEQMLTSAKIVAPNAFAEEGGQEANRSDTPLPLAPARRIKIRVPTSRSSDKLNMPEAILRILGNADRGMTKLGLRERLAEQYPDMNLGKDYVYFYKTMRRMEKAGRVRKRGKILRLPE